MSSQRRQLASDIAAGLAGWLQLQHVQGLAGLSGEDAARLIVAQIVNAQGRYLPATSQLPGNWGTTKRRIDVAIRGRSAMATLWYGAVEVKWLGMAFDVQQMRLAIVQDITRLAFVPTANLNAHFLVVGGVESSLHTLFDKAHTKQDIEDQRVAFSTLLSRDGASPKGELHQSRWSKVFPEAGGRVPATVLGAFDGKLKTELLAHATAGVDDMAIGRAYVWQCNRTRGTEQPPQD